MTNVKVNCDKCGKEFNIPLKRYNWKIKNKEKFYCSKECSIKKRSITCQCKNCGKDIEKPRSQIERSKSGNVFCSKSCSTSFNNRIHKSGKNHHSYIDGLSQYRLNAFINYERRCSVCGWDKDERILEVHHINNSRNDNSLENLIILCPICHKKLTLGLYELVGRHELKEK